MIAATVTTNSVDVAAHAAKLGFDFLWIEMEHSPITLETLRHMVLATRGLTALPFARVPVNELWTAKRVLDTGVSGVMFPFRSTPDLARQAVAACHYPPHGRRGSGASLASSSWPDPDRYYDSADENVTVIIIIEEERAVEQIDEIAATPGWTPCSSAPAISRSRWGCAESRSIPSFSRQSPEWWKPASGTRSSWAGRRHAGAGRGIYRAGISALPGAHRDWLPVGRRDKVSGTAAQVPPETAAEARLLMNPRYKWYVVAMLWWIAFFNYADRQAIFSVFPLLEKELHLTPVELGLLGSSFAWVYGLCAPFAGNIVDRVRRKSAILGGLHAWSAICMATAVSRNFGTLLTFRAAEGLGETFYFPASMSLISDYHGRRPARAPSGSIRPASTSGPSRAGYLRA